MSIAASRPPSSESPTVTWHMQRPQAAAAASPAIQDRPTPKPDRPGEGEVALPRPAATSEANLAVLRSMVGSHHDSEQFRELAVNAQGHLALVGAPKGRKPREPEAVRKLLISAFCASLDARRSTPLSAPELFTHWKAALGIHSGIGTQGRVVMGVHLKMLERYVEKMT